ncbi:Hypothetical protein NTJ_05703 [Nesidiocoris tenuis]|uniref:Uncharacterized protein n=1 Tax=Nesidiocoris tenuis TaxID=355587 RepID=A0ABN7ANS1_9HEMI|nr:Hypothetical protein NTJ_05703 [Nesidiocoris tenuis]
MVIRISHVYPQNKKTGTSNFQTVRIQLALTPGISRWSAGRRSRQRHLTETEAHGVGWSPRGGTACWEDKVQYGETCKRSCGRQEEIQEQDQTCWPDVVKRPDEDLTPSSAV